MEAYELTGARGEPLLFLSVHTGEISNDHLCYYELLYDDSVSPPRLIDRRHWRFDVAGMEGMEFVAIGVFLSVVFAGIGIPLVSAYLAYTRLSKGARVKRGRCPACGYDLRHQFAGGCSECGWGVGEARAYERDLRRYSFVGRLKGAATREPHWKTLILVVVAAVLAWYSSSMPGGVPWTDGPSRFLLLAGLLIFVAKVVCALSLGTRPVRS
jgi:hypothetical protein